MCAHAHTHTHTHTHLQFGDLLLFFPCFVVSELAAASALAGPYALVIPQKTGFILSSSILLRKWY